SPYTTSHTDVGPARHTVAARVAYWTGEAGGVIDRWVRVEEAVESRLHSFRDPTEPLNPGLLYTDQADERRAYAYGAGDARRQVQRGKGRIRKGCGACGGGDRERYGVEVEWGVGMDQG
ncbi:hypothetical protein L210DRAFT_3511759, partial [Boletus edulis BED1]